MVLRFWLHPYSHHLDGNRDDVEPLSILAAGIPRALDLDYFQILLLTNDVPCYFACYWTSFLLSRASMAMEAGTFLLWELLIVRLM